MSIKRISIVLVLAVMLMSMVACSAVYSETESVDALQKAIEKTFNAESSYITIRELGTFTMKNMSGEAKLDKDGNKVTEDKLATKYIVNTYVTTDKKYPEGTRLSEIHIITHDEFANATRTQYWAGKEKNGTDSYLIEKLPTKVTENGKEVVRDIYSRQKIDNENIFEYDKFKMYDKKAILSDWVNLKPENYTVTSGKKAGYVETIKIKIKPEYNKELSEMGEFTIRITNGNLTCIQIVENTPTGDTVVKFQIDYLLEGQFINIPTGDALLAKNPKDENGNPLKDASGNEIKYFHDDANILG